MEPAEEPIIDPSITVPPNTESTGDVMESHTRVWRDVKEDVELTALKYAKDSDELTELVQRTRVWLWESDGSRVDVRSPREITYLRRGLKNLIKLEVKKLRREKGVRMDELPEDVRRQLGA